MAKLTYLCLLAYGLSRALARPQAAEKPPAFFLAGDSTTAVQSSGGGGWGNGFLNTTLHDGAWGINFGHDGATTVSFRAGGDWANVLTAVKNASALYSPYVTIQFGHNDQKTTANITMAQFTANLVAFVKDTLNAGATPIIATSLSRRNYDNDVDPPVVEDDLADVRVAAIQAANQSHSALIHLNERSAAYLNAIGPHDAYTYNLVADDYTHLNGNGSIVFGNLVAELIVQDFPCLSAYVQAEPVIQKDLDAGIYYWPGAGSDNERATYPPRHRRIVSPS